MRKIYMYIIGLAQIIPNEDTIKKATTAEALPVNMGALRWVQWSDLHLDVPSEFTEFILASCVGRSSFYIPEIQLCSLWLLYLRL